MKINCGHLIGILENGDVALCSRYAGHKDGCYSNIAEDCIVFFPGIKVLGIENPLPLIGESCSTLTN